MILDALLGTGFQGEPRGAVAEAIRAINEAPAPVISVDVPSGVDASTWRRPGSAVRAQATATFHASKPGLWINPGKAHAGDVHVIDIGIPRGAPSSTEIGLITDAVLECSPAEPGLHQVLERSRAGRWRITRAHRRSANGSAEATRAGAGYVTRCCQPQLQGIVASAGPGS